MVSLDVLKVMFSCTFHFKRSRKIELCFVRPLLSHSKVNSNHIVSVLSFFMSVLGENLQNGC